MHAGFGFQPAIGIGAADLQRRGFNAGLLAFRPVEHLHLEVPALRPAGVHAQQHFRPVLRFGAAGTGVDFEEGIAAVRLAGEQAFDFLALGFLGKHGECGDSFLYHGLVAFGFGQCDEFQGFVAFALQCLNARDHVGKPATFAHHAFGGGGVIPELRVLGAGVQLRQPENGGIPVKDASATRQGIA